MFNICISVISYYFETSDTWCPLFHVIWTSSVCWFALMLAGKKFGFNFTGVTRSVWNIHHDSVMLMTLQLVDIVCGRCNMSTTGDVWSGTSLRCNNLRRWGPCCWTVRWPRRWCWRTWWNAAWNGHHLGHSWFVSLSDKMFCAYNKQSLLMNGYSCSGTLVSLAAE